MFFLLFFFFFFSSRRRHTRCYRDWSSDVCSSDLHLNGAGDQARGGPLTYADLIGFRDFHAGLAAAEMASLRAPVGEPLHLPLLDAPAHRDSYATDLERLFDDARRREEIARAWKPQMRGVGRLR